MQDFGRRSGVYPVVINGEAASTDLPIVSLYVYGNWSEMRLRAGDGLWSDWQPFQNRVQWALTGTLGEKTMWVEMRSGGQTATSRDTIIFPGVALADIVAAAESWTCQAGQACYRAEYDLDFDGLLDVLDIMGLAVLWRG